MIQTPEQVAHALRGWRAVALTGAGISVPSGIPDFRSPTGLWARYDPFEYGHIASFREDPARSWKMLAELYSTCWAAKPNAAHLALAEMEAQGLLTGVITQNIDHLHQRAGSQQVVCFHGDAATLSCLRGHHTSRWPLTAIPPVCPVCGDILKPDVTLFGEDIAPDMVQGAQALLDVAQSLLVIGTSAEVWPASDIPRVAARRGAPVYEFNIERTPLAQDIDAISVIGDVADTIPRLLSAMTEPR